MRDHGGLHPALLIDSSHHVFCGPTALASIMGKSLAEVEAAIYAHRKISKPRFGARPIKTMWWSEVAPVCVLLGWRIASKDEPFRERRGCHTFARWLLYTRNAADGPYLVLITGHFAAVSDGWLVDNNGQRRIPQPISTVPHWRKKRVKAWAKLEPMEGE